MSGMSWVSLLNSGQYNQLNLGTALANSTVATDVTAGANTAGQAFAFPAGFLQVGQEYEVTCRGIASTTGTPNLTLGLYYGGVAGTALATTGASVTSSGMSNNIWKLSAEFRVDSVGTSGAIRTLGEVSGVSTGVLTLPASSSSGNSVTVDTSTSKILTVGATWGTAAAGNTLQVVMFRIRALN